jgi:polysaccharide deacetylase family protein (PEP-CTERM system associated)
MKNILTIDIEDWFHILDIPSSPILESWKTLESRVEKNTLTILDLLDKYQTKGTFFILGWVAEHFPDLIREIEKRGHDLGSHGYSHQLVYQLTPEEFRRDVSLSLEYLARISSRKILGYRAPGFSIASASLWATDILVEMGFVYDSSVFPLKRNHGGFPEFSGKDNYIITPKGARLLEIAVTPIDIFGKNVYLLGGGYFRLAPYTTIARAISHLNKCGKPALIYLHPREFDADHPRLKMNFLRSYTSYVNLKQTHIKFERTLQQFSFSSIEKIWNLHEIDTSLAIA